MTRALRRWWYRGKRDRRKIAGVPSMPEELFVSHDGQDRIHLISWGTIYITPVAPIGYESLKVSR